MRTFPLRIGTPDGLLFEGEVQRIVCRSITGDLAILAGHCNFCTALGMGEAHVILEDGTSPVSYTHLSSLTRWDIRPSGQHF